MPTLKAPTFKDPASLPLFKRHTTSEIAELTGYAEVRVIGAKRGWSKRQISTAFMNAVTVAFPEEPDLFTEATA